MSTHAWVDEFPAAITICDDKGIIVEMNDRSADTFKEDGGRALIGADLLACHPEPARARLVKLLSARSRNVYTVEKRGVRKLIYQSPWYRNGQFAGMVELSLEIPSEMPHFVREG